jgi:hypothetical protein
MDNQKGKAVTEFELFQMKNKLKELGVGRGPLVESGLRDCIIREEVKLAGGERDGGCFAGHIVNQGG